MGTNNSADLDSLCQQWGVPDNLCSKSFSFNSTVDLFHADREGSDTFMPMLDVAFKSNLKSGSTPLLVMEKNMTDVSNSSSHPLCKQMVRVHHCTGMCNNNMLMEYLEAPEKPPSLAEIMHYPQFWMFFCLMLFAWSAFASVVTLSDTICFMMLGKCIKTLFKVVCFIIKLQIYF